MVSLRRRGGASDFLPIPQRRKDTKNQDRAPKAYVLWES